MVDMDGASVFTSKPQRGGRKTWRALAAHPLGQHFLQHHPACRLASRDTGATVQIQTLEHPVWRPDHAGDIQGVCCRTGAAGKDVVPGGAPAHQPRMAASHLVVAAGQKGQAPAAVSPLLQRFDHRPLSERPVVKVRHHSRSAHASLRAPRWPAHRVPTAERPRAH